MTTAATLRHRITLQRQTEELDSLGQPADWVDVATVWAAVEPLRGREFWAAQQANAEQTIKVRIRYRPGVSADMRIRYGERILQLVAPPIDVGERHRDMELLCREINP